MSDWNATPARYCVSCGNGLVATAAFCPRCGTPVGTMRTVGETSDHSRAVGVILAVLVSFWSFLYRYRLAPWKCNNNARRA